MYKIIRIIKPLKAPGRHGNKNLNESPLKTPPKSHYVTNAHVEDMSKVYLE